VRAALRVLIAIVVSGVAAAVLFLIMIQGSFRKGYTDLDFNHVLGTMIKGSAEEQTGKREAFALVGDTAGPTGLYATLAAGVVLMAFHGLVITRLVRRHWAIQGLVLGAVTALVVGLVFCGVADARLDTPTGLFGVDAGGFTAVVLILCSLGFGIAGARCYSLITSPSWYEGEREEDHAAAIESAAELEPSQSSLELAEEGPEQGRVGT
jgi:hypothetical protein